MTQLPSNCTIIYECLSGSRAYGLATPESDEDIRGIFLLPVEQLLSHRDFPDHYETQAPDIWYWELRHFIRLALKGNPNILELLWSDEARISTVISQQLLKYRTSFLSKRCFKTYRGCAFAERKKFEQSLAAVRSNCLTLGGSVHDFLEVDKQAKWKHAMHYLRILITACWIFRLGRVVVRLDSLTVAMLRDVRAGLWTWAAVLESAGQWETLLVEAYTSTTLPDAPNESIIEQILLEIRANQVLDHFKSQLIVSDAVFYFS